MNRASFRNNPSFGPSGRGGGGGSAAVVTDTTLTGLGTLGSPLGVNPLADLIVASLWASRNNASIIPAFGQLNAVSTNVAGHAVLQFWINAALRAQIRADSGGNLNLAATGTGSVATLVGGDFGVGQIVQQIYQSGNIFAANLGVSGTSADPGMKLCLFGGRFGLAKGANVGSASTTTLGNDGNYFHITGTNTINYITKTNWLEGARLLLYFESALILTHNAGAVPANTYALDLEGDVDASMPAGSLIEFIIDDSLTKWVEVGRRGA